MTDPNKTYESLFDTPAEAPELPEPGKWHQNPLITNMAPYDKPHHRADGLIGYTVEHEYHIDREVNPIVRQLIADLGTHDKDRNPKLQQAITGQLAKRFWKEAKRQEITIDETTIGKWGLPEKWLTDKELSHERFDGSRAIQVGVTERDDWHDPDVKFKIMKAAIDWKYALGTSWAKKLEATGRLELVEWNNWKDTTYGKDIVSGHGDNHLGRMVMEKREENRKITKERSTQKNDTAETTNATILKIQQEQKLKPAGYLLDHLLGKENSSKDLEIFGERLRNINTAETKVENIQEYHTKKYITIVGTRNISEQEKESIIWAARTLADSGYIVRSGAADGADKAAEDGARASQFKEKALEIWHPYDRTTKGSDQPGNYVFRDGQYKEIAHDLVRGLTEHYEKMSVWSKALQARDIAQVFGRDGKTPSEAIFFVAKEHEFYTTHGDKGLVEGGTRFAVYTGRLSQDMGFKEIPEFNLRKSKENFQEGVLTLVNAIKQENTNQESPIKTLLKKQEDGKSNLFKDSSTQNEENRQAQAAAKRLISKAREFFNAQGKEAVFSKVGEEHNDFFPLARDGSVVLLGQSSGSYSLVDEIRTRIRNDWGEIPQITLEAGTVRLKRAQDGIVEAWQSHIDLVSPELKAIQEKSR